MSLKALIHQFVASLLITGFLAVPMQNVMSCPMTDGADSCCAQPASGMDCCESTEAKPTQTTSASEAVLPAHAAKQTPIYTHTALNVLTKPILKTDRGDVFEASLAKKHRCKSPASLRAPPIAVSIDA